MIDYDRQASERSDPVRHRGRIDGARIGGFFIVAIISAVAAIIAVWPIMVFWINHRRF